MRTEANSFYWLDCVRNAIMVIVDVPGERWEVEFFEDCHVEIEHFVSTGDEDREESLFDYLFNELAP